MIAKTTSTLMVMFTLDFNTLDECVEISMKMYDNNRCYESTSYWLEAPHPKPQGFEELLREYRQIILEKQGY
tara:strand:+ start:796 stop:1011 length:216 start_codon:yes stop_codon:yes gene_type:complete